MSLAAMDVVNNVLSATVKHQQYKEALATFLWIAEFTEKHGKERGFLLTGPSGSGKTKLAQTMLDALPAIEEAERTRIRVLMISMPANPTIISLCKLILDDLGQRYARNATEADLGYQLKKVLVNTGACMLIIDEAQHLVDGRKINKTPAMVADWIKQLMTDVHISVTLIGIARVERLMRANEQLSRRFTKRIRLGGFGVNNKANKAKLNNAVSKLIQESGYKGDSDYTRLPSTLEMIYYATNGRLGYLALLLSEALRLAVEEDANALTQAHFFQAFENEIWSEAKPKDNPFSGKFAPRALVHCGEPFYEEIA